MIWAALEAWRFTLAFAVVPRDMKRLSQQRLTSLERWDMPKT